MGDPMKTWTTAFGCVAVLLLGPESSQAQRLNLDGLEDLAAQASETVNITIDEGMLKAASSLFQNQGNSAQAKALLSELKAVYVRAFEFDRNVDTASHVNRVRKQLADPGWTRLITVESKRERELAEVYLWREGNASGGLAIIAAEPGELTVVNIVGAIDLEKLNLLQGQFGIPRLPIR